MDFTGLKNHNHPTENQFPTTLGAAPSEDGGQLSSFSHSPSPKIASILIHPSDSGASRPKSSEGRINLSKDALPRTHRVVSAGLKKRPIGAQADKALEKEPSIKTDPFLNFGIGEGFLYGEDPLILKDVQKALNAKARRSAQQHSPSAKVSQESRDSVTTQRMTAPGTTIQDVSIVPPSGQSLFQKAYLPSSHHASSLSLQSNSSEDLLSKSPVPVLVSFPDGTSYLDWSGKNPSANVKDKPRTFSLSKRESKPGEFSRNGDSLNFKTSQKDFHLAVLDDLRRRAKRETLSKAEKIKEELNRRYSFLTYRKPSALNPLVVLRTRQEDSATAPPFWYLWRAKRPLHVSRWTLTANNIDEYLCSIGIPFPQDSHKSRFPAPRFSPLSSPRPSFSSSPGSHNRKESKSMEFLQAASTSITEVINSSSTRPNLSINPNILPTSSRVSLQTPAKAVTEYDNAALVSSGQPESIQSKGAKTDVGQSFARGLRMSLVVEDPTNPPTTSSGNTRVEGLPYSGGQHTILRSSFENVRKSEDEAISSISDEGELVAMSRRELTKRNLTAPKLNDHGKTSYTSESEAGIRPFNPYSSQDGISTFQGSSISGERHSKTLSVPAWHSRRYGQVPDVKNPRELEKLLKLEEEEEKIREIYRTREQLLLEANDRNRKIARLLKGICNSLKEYQRTQSALSAAGISHRSSLPHEVMEAIYSDPATTLRHGKGWKAVEDSYNRFHEQRTRLSSYISQLTSAPPSVVSSRLETTIETARYLWGNLQKASEQIESRVAMVEPALSRAMEHVENVQKEYNSVQMLSETDYPVNQVIADLETYILESQAPRGWLEFAAIWVPVHVLEVIGGFIRFFGVPMSEKFIRPFLWYFFRDQYWKVYSTEPSANGRTWYTRLAYWFVIMSILAWYVAPPSESFFDQSTVDLSV